MLFELVVDELGMLTDIQLLSPLGFGLDERAQEAIEKWRFRPGKKNGKPVKVSANIEVNFRLMGALFSAKETQRRTEYNRAVLELQGNSKETALATLQDLAQKKHPAAMFAYGKLLARGKELPADPQRSRELIAQAAQARYAPAMFALAMESIEQKRAPQELEKERQMILDAAVLGNIDAQYYLGSAYEKGNPDAGFQQDGDRARQYYRLCAAAGERRCQLKLGELLLNRPDRPQRDLVQAIAWLELAADQGDAEAKSIAERNRAGLIPEEIKRLTFLKQKLVHQPLLP